MRSLAGRLALPLLAVLVGVACGTTTSAGPGTVRVVGDWTGPDQASFMAVVKPFETQTGIEVTYESTSDEAAILKTSVAAGTPPDLAGASDPQIFNQLAQQGKLLPLNGVVDMSAMAKNYAATWLDLGEPLHDGKLYEVYSWASPKGLIWYDPKAFQAASYNIPTSWQAVLDLASQVKAGGTTPWCLGLHSAGADDGWPATDWLGEIVLSQAGSVVYDNWVAGKQLWSSPEIKSAFQTFGQVLGPGDANVYGGPKQMLATSYKTAGDPLFSSPPKCYLHNQASFITSNFTADSPSLQPITDFNFFPLPAITGQFAGAHVVSADAFAMLHDTPQARKLIQYLTTADAQGIWVKRGGKLSPNNQTPASEYPDQISSEGAQILLNTQLVRFDATAGMPGTMRSAAWTALLHFVSNQTNLVAILAALDKVQKTAYTAQ